MRVGNADTNIYKKIEPELCFLFSTELKKKYQV